MTKKARNYLLAGGALLLLVGVPSGVLQCRIARSAAFCEAAAALPRSELDQFASRCNRLMRERGGPKAGLLELIADTNIVAQFTLAGRRPYEVVLENGTVGIKYFGGNWRYSTLAIWEEGYSPNGEPITALKITYGTYGWRVLSQGGEPGGPANRSQPVDPGTNRTSSAAGSGG